MKYLSDLFLAIYRALIRIKAKLFSLLISGAFSEFGKNTVLAPPIRLVGENRIAVGARVFIGENSWLQALSEGVNNRKAISIGNGTSIAGACVISAVQSVVLEEDVLLARNVYIADHSHRFSQFDRPILAQGIDKIEPVLIKRGAWLGQNVVVCPGVTIGQCAVIGANSVVNEDIPDFSVAVGAPARVVRTLQRRTA